jgi:CelD/BcsL family acetyltransferase involved in cellulose biosynthesis
MNLNRQKIEIKTETFERLESFFLNNESDLNWNCLFVLPLWMKTWWDTFGENHDPEILAGYRDGKLIGLAPLHIQGETARFIGGENVCDYQDMIVSSNHHHEFLNAILAHLIKKRIRFLQLGTLRPDSVSLTQLPDLAKQMGYAVEFNQVAFSYEILLPNTWESYLYMLKGKQRHEIRRKLRRLNEAGDVKFRVLERLDEISEAMDTFFSLFKASRPDKSEFLTEQMMSFFRLLAQRMVQQGFLRLFFLDIDQVPAAGVMCFDYNDTIFLYNNGYNPQFSSLSPGFLSKVYSIRNSIDQGKLRYDLLKGDEGYKKRLGSTPVPLYHLKIDLEG